MPSFAPLRSVIIPGASREAGNGRSGTLIACSEISRAIQIAPDCAGHVIQFSSLPYEVLAY